MITLKDLSNVMNFKETDVYFIVEKNDSLQYLHPNENLEDYYDYKIGFIRLHGDELVISLLKQK
jgi:hypothetical protein